MAKFRCIIWVCICNFAISIWSSPNTTFIAAANKYIWTQLTPQVMHQNIAVILRQFCYGNISFIIFVPGRARASSRGRTASGKGGRTRDIRRQISRPDILKGGSAWGRRPPAVCGSAPSERWRWQRRRWQEAEVRKSKSCSFWRAERITSSLKAIAQNNKEICQVMVGLFHQGENNDQTRWNIGLDNGAIFAHPPTLLGAFGSPSGNDGCAAVQPNLT